MDLSTKFTRESRKQYLIPKIRNLIHYRLIDTRPRAQYIHVLRDIKELCKDETDGLLKDIYKTIPDKVKNTESIYVVLKLKDIYDSYTTTEKEGS